MDPILLAIALTVSTNTVKIASFCPLVGSWSVQTSHDLCRWRVVASGRSWGKETLSVTIPKEEMGFVRVEFRKDDNE